jgi:transcriptional regulator with XRE-family HTH domain
MINKTDQKRSNQVIGNNLKRVRLQKSLTQAEVAIATCLDRSYVCRIENGKARITYNLLKQLVVGLEIHSSELIEF